MLFIRSMLAARIATVPVVREILRATQRAIGEQYPLVAEGRDMASTAVVPGAPMLERPILWKISPTESPTAGVGARERSATPKGRPRRVATSVPIISPTRVTL